MPKKVVDIFLSRTYVARSKGGRTEMALLQRNLIRSHPIKVYIDHFMDLVILKRFLSLNTTGARLEEVVITEKCLSVIFLDPNTSRYRQFELYSDHECL